MITYQYGCDYYWLENILRDGESINIEYEDIKFTLR